MAAISHSQKTTSSLWKVRENTLITHTRIPKDLVRIILSYELYNYFGTPSHRQHQFTKRDCAALYLHFFYSINSENECGEMLFRLTTSLGKPQLQVYPIVPPSKSRVEVDLSFSNIFIPTLIVSEASDQFTLFNEKNVRELVRFDNEQAQWIVSQREMNAPLQFRDGVLYRRYDEYASLPLPHPIAESNVDCWVSFLHANFTFVGGWKKLEKKDRKMVEVETSAIGNTVMKEESDISNPTCLVFYNRPNSECVVELTPANLTENDRPDHCLANHHREEAISLFANDDIVALSWGTRNNHVACAVWEMNTWIQINSLQTRNTGYFRQCIGADRGTIVIAAEGWTAASFEYFDF